MTRRNDLKHDRAVLERMADPVLESATDLAHVLRPRRSVENAQNTGWQQCFSSER